MKIKTAELIGPTLDWVVAKCGGTPGLHIIQKPGKTCVYGVLKMPSGEMIDWPVQPSTDWSQGGPIIHREKIGVWWDGVWHAKYDGCLHEEVQDADDPLLAAMRCYVASRLGDEVEIPEELL